jgi:hypothetical protein
LVLLLFGSDSGSSRGVLPNVFVKKLFLSKEQRSLSRFDEATNYDFSKTLCLLYTSLSL